MGRLAGSEMWQQLPGQWVRRFVTGTAAEGKETGHAGLNRFAGSELWQGASPGGGLRLPYWPCSCFMNAAVIATLALEESLQLQQQRTECKCQRGLTPAQKCYLDGCQMVCFSCSPGGNLRCSHPGAGRCCGPATSCRPSQPRYTGHQ